MKKLIFGGTIILFLIASFAFAHIIGVFAGSTHKIAGWAWSENIGWLSMNCFDFGLNTCDTVDYGVDYNLNTGDVTGWAWSEYGGWLCFGSTCAENGLPKSPDEVAPVAKISDKGLLSGWANWTVLGQDGWIKLQGIPKVSPVGIKYNCANCTMLKTDVAPNYSCGFCFTSEASSGSGNICTDCTKCQNGRCDTCTQCYSYGLAVDYSKNKIAGWAWNRGAGEPAAGFGWLQFQGTKTTTVASPPFFETVGGDIYAQKGVGDMTQGATPSNIFNGMYLVQSNGEIINFSNQCQSTGNCDAPSGWVNEDPGFVGQVPKQENLYAGSFAKLDLKGLYAGQYGEVKKIETMADITQQLYGRVYYKTGDFELGGRTIPNSVGTILGAGTIIIKGDVYIKSDLKYSTNTASKIKNLASLGVIVLKKDDGTGGNIYISPEVKSVSGAYLCEGTVYTGTKTNQQDVPLEVNGLIVAKEIKLERNYRDQANNVPAERVIYDGRVISNTPPGFNEIAKSMPDWQ